MRDIDHYLNGEPLDARPDGLRYRAGKFIRRHVRPVAAAAITFSIIVGLTVVFTWRLAKARNDALAEAARTQRIQRFMIDIFQGGDAIAGPAADVKVVDMLDRGARAAQALESDPKVRADLLFNFAQIHEKQGQLEKAESLFLSALDQRKALYGADSSEVAETLTALGLLRADQSRLEEAEPLVRDALAMAKRHLSMHDPVVSSAEVAVARVLGQRGAYPEAIGMLEQAIQSHPKVREVAVVGAPGPHGDDVVRCVVVARGQCTPEEIVRHCEGRIADYKIPSRIEFRDALPKSETGKLLRQRL